MMWEIMTFSYIIVQKYKMHELQSVSLNTERGIFGTVWQKMSDIFNNV